MRDRGTVARLVVHLGLIVSATVALVLAHLGQRRRVTSRPARRLLRGSDLARPAGRLAVSDSVLVVLTTVMLGSGLWDWLDHPTTIRWHGSRVR
jgi:hypothetical protein